VLADYLPIVILLALALAFGVLSMVVSRLFRPHDPTPVKLSAYECGIEPERLPEGERFSVKFYLVAMLFIIFDVETIFLFVWAISLRALGIFGLLTMAVFIALLFVVEAYVWMKGGFEWERPPRRSLTPRDAGLRLGPDDRDDPNERGREAAARAR
jgi:NADH-quinone oxidoreductase subunit A